MKKKKTKKKNKKKKTKQKKKKKKKKKKMGKLLSPGIPPIDERRGNLIECSTVVMSQLIIIECVIFAIIISCGALLSYS